jgi:hypothetical protein
MTDTTEQLALAGEALQHAWRRDLAQSTRRIHVRRPRTVVLILAAAVALGGGVALASSLLKSPAEEQTGMIEANTLFAGSDPGCVAVSHDAFHCTLDKPPEGETFFSQDGTQLLDVFLGMKVATVDSTQHIDGGCVSRSADGLSWDCYLGAAAVAHDVVSPQLLGRLSPGPAAA